LRHETGHDSAEDGISYLTDYSDHLTPVFAAEARLRLVKSGIEYVVIF
jgi:hypothetical protein